MERVEVLIHKLVTQQQAAASPEALLQTVRFLYTELVAQQKPATPDAARKVAVVLPSVYVSPGSPEVSEGSASTSAPPAPPAVAEAPAPVEPLPEPVAAPQVETKTEPYALRRPSLAETPAPPARMELPFDVPADIPTLRAQTGPQRELHELLGEKGASLNDKLKAEKTELGQSLKTEPIRDLRKGIGVNDKFVFISELFRGDETMYDSSIRTINAFHILPEAEYWINRELKVKLGWNDTNETVQHFYGVVRRRFS
jgi:hypothetical protein